MQEAFFGKDLMDTTKDKDIKSSSDSEDEKNVSGSADTILLSQDELRAIEQVKSKNDNDNDKDEEKLPNEVNIKREEIMEEDGSDTEALGDILPMTSDLLDSDLVNTIMNEPDEDLAKAGEALEELDDTPGPSKDEFTDILSPHFNLASMVRDTGLPNMDSKDVEEIFKGVLTDESQESQESSVFPIQSQAPHTPVATTPLVSPSPHPGMQGGLPLGRPQVPGSLPSVGQSTLNSPMSFPPPSPYQSEYSNSPQQPDFSPVCSEPRSPWVNPDDEGSGASGGSGGTAISYNQRSNLKMESDEALSTSATISSVLYANMNHPEWKTEYPDNCIRRPDDESRPGDGEQREPGAAARQREGPSRIRSTPTGNQIVHLNSANSGIIVKSSANPAKTIIAAPVSTTTQAVQHAQQNSVAPATTNQIAAAKQSAESPTSNVPTPAQNTPAVGATPATTTRGQTQLQLLPGSVEAPLLAGQPLEQRRRRRRCRNNL